MNLFLENGYLNFKKIRHFAEDNGIRYVYIVGGRGTGKTYGAIESYLFEEPEPFLWLRRTQKQSDIIGNPAFNPFKKNAKSKDLQVLMKRLEHVDNISAIYLTEDQSDDALPAGPPMGYTAALSTFSSIRGFDGDDIKAILYDEFIPEAHERPIKEEAAAFFNCYETVNRNRELEDPPRPPVTVFCLANANDLGNPIFLHAGHVQTCLNMRKKKQDTFIDFNRGYMIILLDESPISQQKQETALYKYLGSNDFTEMSLSNVFTGEKDIRVATRPLGEYKPVVTAGELTVYRHKGAQLPHYVTFHRSGACPVFGSSETELQRFKNQYSYLWLAYLRDRLEFEDYGAELLFKKYMK